MQSIKRTKILSGSLREPRAFLIGRCMIVLIVVACFLSIETSKTHASTNSSDPLVTIAFDRTSPSCVVTQIAFSPVTQQQIWKKRGHCPLGTSIGTKNIALSEARASNDAYAIYPLKSAPISEWVKWHKEVLKLIDRKMEAMRVKDIPAVSGPNSTCGYNVNSGTYDSYLGTYINFEVWYHVSTDCRSLVLNREEVIGELPVVAAAYWTEVAYSYYENNCPEYNEYIGSQDLKIYPGVQEPSGLYNIWYVGAGDPCFGYNSSPDYGYSTLLV